MVKRMRVIIRWIHIVAALITMCYIYSPFHEIVIFQVFMKFGVIPLVTLTGIWIWKFKSINKFLQINA